MPRLVSDRLAVEVDDPAAVPGPMPRWSRMGFIRQVVLDRRWPLCAGEFADGRPGGAGLCQEFNMSVPPPGFTGGRAGDRFIKPGTGSVIHPGGAHYDFRAPYPWTPVAIRVEQPAPDRLLLSARHEPCAGTWLELDQDLVLAGTSLTATCRVANHGSSDALLEEYRHDFLAPGGQPPTGAVLHLDGPLRPDLGQPQPWRVGPPVAGPDPAAIPITLPARNHHLDRCALLAPLHRWILATPGQPTVAMASDRPWAMLGIYTTSWQCSVEAFLRLPCPAGGSVAWTRVWRFAAPGEAVQPA